jgi:hypothetical protein
MWHDGFFAPFQAWLRAGADACTTVARRLATAARLCTLMPWLRSHVWVPWRVRLTDTAHAISKCISPTLSASPRLTRPRSLQVRVAQGRRIVQGAPRGAGLCRVAAARRGARLARWSAVRERRATWLWSMRRCSKPFLQLTQRGSSELARG